MRVRFRTSAIPGVEHAWEDHVMLAAIEEWQRQGTELRPHPELGPMFSRLCREERLPRLELLILAFPERFKTTRKGNPATATKRAYQRVMPTLWRPRARGRLRRVA